MREVFEQERHPVIGVGADREEDAILVNLAPDLDRVPRRLDGDRLSFAPSAYSVTFFRVVPTWITSWPASFHSPGSIRPSIAGGVPSQATKSLSNWTNGSRFVLSSSG
jgi:hypothetical protein